MNFIVVFGVEKVGLMQEFFIGRAMNIMFGGKSKVVRSLVTSNSDLARNPNKLNRFVFRTETVD